MLDKFDKYCLLPTTRGSRMALNTSEFLGYYMKKYDKYISTTDSKPGHISLMGYMGGTSLAPSSKATIVTLISSFLLEYGYIDDKQKSSLTARYHMIQPDWGELDVSDDVVHDILSEALKTRNRHSRRRDPLIIYLLAALGPRVSQISMLNDEHITEDTGKYKFAFTKQKKHEETIRKSKHKMQIQKDHVLLGDFHIGELMENYKPHKGHEAYFTSNRGDRITRRAIYNSVKLYSGKVGADNITPHSFRHYFGSKMAMVSPLKASMMLDHSDMKTTQLYISKSEEMMTI